MIPQQEVVDFVKRHKKFFESSQLSFFEMTVGMAFEYFKNEQVDIAIVEVGLGGRLDSTNIIMPELAAITNIGLDHTEFLGETLGEIAFEKGGIIKQGIPVVIGEVMPETRDVFTSIAKGKNAPLYFAEEMALPTYQSDLKGSYQQKNIRTVTAIIEVMRQKGWVLPEAGVKNALLHVRERTGMKGRWQWLAEQPRIVCDTAHNEDGIREVMAQLSHQDYKQLYIVLGVVKEKPLNIILSYFPKDASYYFCAPDIPRGLPVGELEETARMAGLNGRSFNSVSDAYQTAKQDAGIGDLIFVGGSTFTVAEVL
jgi:dihydrofolate synthase/folylpolyglutamate synthase